ncbi:hypothetical protein GCM10027346_06470 [Hymenobacter seoulensis]
MTEKDLADLLLQSRRWNTDHQLTGILLYSHGDIMQVLEGPKEEVDYIFERIRQDTRHFRLIKLADGPIQARNFSQWSMGFKAFSPEEFRHLPGYQNPESRSFLASYSETDNDLLHTLLATFIHEDDIRL